MLQQSWCIRCLAMYCQKTSPVKTKPSTAVIAGQTQLDQNYPPAGCPGAVWNSFRVRVSHGILTQHFKETGTQHLLQCLK